MKLSKAPSETPVQANDASAGQERILDAAYSLFIERGFRDVSMQEIAAAAGVTKGAPYYHFKDKEELFGQVVLREMERIRARLVALLERDAPFRERLEAVASFVFAMQSTDLVRLSADLERHVSPERRAALRQQFSPPYEVIRPYFAQAAAAGEFQRVAPETAAAIFQSMIFGQTRLARRRASLGGAATFDATPHAIVDVLFSGI